MLNIVIGTGVVFGIIFTIYTLGLLPNLWSNLTISFNSYEDVIDRGIHICFVLMFISLIIGFLYLIGMIILTKGELVCI